MARSAWAVTKVAIASGRHELVLLDEITYPVNWGWIGGEEVAGCISSRPVLLNVFVTAGDAPSALVEIADTVPSSVSPMSSSRCWSRPGRPGTTRGTPWRQKSLPGHWSSLALSVTPRASPLAGGLRTRWRWGTASRSPRWWRGWV
jgi:hypothetical protein